MNFFSNKKDNGVKPLSYPGFPSPDAQIEYYNALKKMDWNAVKKDLKALMKDSKEEYPADYGHYGGFFIRMAWHSTGTYRMSDGRGGADGGCQRFEPELSWEDNGNLCHAHKLLRPIKLKYGTGLSWGDLIVLAGTVAIEDMGGPVLGFAAGRIDHIDNSQSISLGPSEEQKAFCPVGTQGDMKFPLGANTMGLIYVNPEGFMGEPDPQKAANTIRDVFGRMGMDDRENVALIGGGHSVGKAHGANEEGPGAPPMKCPFNPYPGRPGGGRGNDTSTSKLEGAWTSNPIKFDNEYFKNLLNHKWEKHKGPGGRWQWRVKGNMRGKHGPKAPKAHGEGDEPIFMLTTDIALAVDSKYRKYVEEFAEDEEAYREAFAKVWYKLVNRDMGPYSRLVGPDVAPAQDWQHPLPPPPKVLPDKEEVKASISKLFEDQEELVMQCIKLARVSANTFRHTDYLGGANGARIRFCLDWEAHKGLDKPLQSLKTVKDEFGDSLTWSALIILAGTVAVESLGSGDIPLTLGNRSDDTSGAAWDTLKFTNEKAEKDIEEVKYRNALRGFSLKEFAALMFPEYPSVDALSKLMSGPAPTVIDGYSATLFDPMVKQHVDEFIVAGDKEYKAAFRAAWTKLMTADMFDGPLGATA